MGGPDATVYGLLGRLISIPRKKKPLTIGSNACHALQFLRLFFFLPVNSRTQMIYSRVLAAGLFLVSSSYSCPLIAGVMNGDFSSGLMSWETEGSVIVTSEGALLADDTVTYSNLFQPVNEGPGRYELAFEFRSDLGAPNPPVSDFSDLGFVSIYFVDDIVTFELTEFAASFDTGTAVLDVDDTGVTFANSAASIGYSPQGGEWARLTMLFDSSHQWIIPAFELFEFNFQDNDSTFFVNNVTLEKQTVPAPPTWALCVIGGPMLFRMARRSGRSDRRRAPYWMCAGK